MIGKTQGGARLSLFFVLLISIVFTSAEVVHQSLLSNWTRILNENTDWKALNDAVADVILEIPPATVERTVLASTLTLDLPMMQCRNMAVDDLSVKWTDHANGTLTALFNTQWDLSCKLNFDYSYLVFSGSGMADISMENSSFDVGVAIEWPAATGDSTGVSWPSNISFDSCTPEVLITDLELDGAGLGLMANALGALENLMKETVASEIETVLCDELSALQEVVQDSFGRLEEILDPYLHSEDDAVIDPLSREREVSAGYSDGVLLNFAEPTTMWETLANDTLSSVHENLDLVMSVVRSTLFEADGGIFVELPETANGTGPESEVELIGNMTLRIRMESVRLYGLDSIVNMSPIVAMGNHTLRAGVEWERWTAKLRIAFELESPTTETGVSSTFSDMIDVEVDVQDLSISGVLLIAIDQELLGSAQLSAILGGRENLLECLHAILKALELTELTVNSISLFEPKVTAQNTPGLQKLLEETTDGIWARVNPLLIESLPGFVSGFALAELGGLIDDMFKADGSASACKNSFTTSADSALIDFRDLLLPPTESVEYGGSGDSPYGDVMFQVKDTIASAIFGEESNQRQRRRALSLLSVFGSGDFVFSDNLVDVDTNIDFEGLQAKFALSVGNISVQNLDSIGEPYSFLDPVKDEPYYLNNSLTTGLPPNPIRVKASVGFQFGIEGEIIHNEFDLGVALSSATLLAEFVVKMLQNGLFSFPIADITNMHCWLATMPAPALTEYGIRSKGSGTSLSVQDLAVNVGGVEFTVDCFNCSSPKMLEISDRLESAEGKEAAAQSARNVINFIANLVTGPTSVLQVEIDRLLVEAPIKCPHSAEYDPVAQSIRYEPFPLVEPAERGNGSFFIAVIAAMVGVAVLVTLVHFSLRCVVSRRHRNWLASLPPDTVLAIYERQAKEQEFEKAVNKCSASMFMSDRLPLLVKWFIPIVLIGNIGLFLSGHFSLGGEVMILINIGGDEVALNNFYSFSIAQSGIELWNIGSRAIAILLLLFSGVWPYTKQLITLALWFLPPKLVPIANRGSILLWLDALAKWSMVDVFVMIVTLVAFQLTIQSPDKSFLPESLYRIDFMVVPVWGLYANMTAQLLSQVTSHVIIHYHRVLAKAAALKAMAASHGSKSVDPEKGLLDGEGSSSGSSPEGTDQTTSSPTSSSAQTDDVNKYPLFQHEFERPHRGEHEKLQPRRFVNPTLIAAAITTSVLILVGCVLPSFGVEYLGLVGLAVESGTNFQDAIQHFSVFSISSALMEQARFLGTAKHYIGMGSIAALLVLSTLIVPIFLVSASMVEWFVPLRSDQRSRIRAAAEILQAWQYVEVYVISIIIGVWQLGPLSTFVINSYCESFKVMFSRLVFHGLLSPDDAQCFQVRPSVESGTGVLIAGALFLYLATEFTAKAAVQRARDETFSARKIESPAVGSCVPEQALQSIKPVPILFTDVFRWVLERSK